MNEQNIAGEKNQHTETAKTSSAAKKWTGEIGRATAAGLAGMILGLLIAGIAMIVLMPAMMIKTHEVDMSVDEAELVLKEAMEEEGWASPGTIHINKSLETHGVSFEPTVKIVQLCKAKYAKEVLTTDRYVSAMMPCAVSIWEGDDGKTYVSKINTGLMGKMFGGKIAEVMGGYVAKEEEAMLSKLLKK